MNPQNLKLVPDPIPETYDFEAFDRMLALRKFNQDMPPPENPSRFKVSGITFATPGNLQVACADIKSGKSAYIGAMIAAAIKDREDCDTFGILASNPKNLAILQIDTEHPPHDHHAQVQTILRRAGLNRTPPCLHSYCLTGFTYKKARLAFMRLLDQVAQLHGGLHSCFIDGHADLVRDVNDAAESNEFVAAMHETSIQYDCPITGILHYNPDSKKSRGHLGSQLERKSETNLQLYKDRHGIISVQSFKQRKEPIRKGIAPSFHWDETSKMHISVATTSFQEPINSAHQDDIQALFQDTPLLSHSELEKVTAKIKKCATRTARRKIADWIKSKAISKTSAGLYSATT